MDCRIQHAVIFYLVIVGICLRFPRRSEFEHATTILGYLSLRSSEGAAMCEHASGSVEFESVYSYSNGIVLDIGLLNLDEQLRILLNYNLCCICARSREAVEVRLGIVEVYVVALLKVGKRLHSRELDISLAYLCRYLLRSTCHVDTQFGEFLGFISVVHAQGTVDVNMHASLAVGAYAYVGCHTVAMQILGCIAVVVILLEG